jgi:hypothetical protein
MLVVSSATGYPMSDRAVVSDRQPYPDRSTPGRCPGTKDGVLFFFSSRLGCFGSLLVSAVLTVVLIWLLRH